MDHSILKKGLFLLAAVFTFNTAIAQDTTSRKLNSVEVTGVKSGFKQLGLYDNELEEKQNIRGFNQLTIFENDLTKDFWTSKNTSCVKGRLIQEKENNLLHLKWNKDLDGCNWVGLGFGWDGWIGKDMGYIVDTVAIELIVRSNGKPFTNIPWAFGIEDYSGQQAWLGYNRSFLTAENVSAEWTKVQIPFSLFPFDENDVDLTNVKQLIIQVFSEGEIEIKKIHLIPFSKKLKKEAHAVISKGQHKVDGNLKEWGDNFVSLEDDQEFSVAYTSEMLYFAFKIKDKSPRENNRAKDELWNGDAIEIAFSTNPQANKKRKFLLLSDQHLGLNCGQNPYVWNWKMENAVDEVEFKFNESTDGYNVEVGIPFQSLFKVELKPGMQLDFEVAVDLNKGNQREKQIRWNSSYSEGFHTSPQKWGVLIFD